MLTYIGNGAYCYANATAMLLASGGEHVSPGLVEVLTGTGLGAMLERNEGNLWFSGPAGAPDVGLARALELLGFAAAERAQADGEAAPFDELRQALAGGPVVLGPLDMGYLTYIPYHEALGGADHYVLAYAMDGKAVHLHDPAGFPHVSLPLDRLALAWRAERVPYRRGAYRSWTAPRRVARPSPQELYARALTWFQECYRAADALVAQGVPWAEAAGSEAIKRFGARLAAGEVSERTRSHLVDFALPLGARRALDYAAFFEGDDADLATLKQRQAVLFGRGHTFAVARRWEEAGSVLAELAEVEGAFQAALLARDVHGRPALAMA
jgi:hypothetical protein